MKIILTCIYSQIIVLLVYFGGYLSSNANMTHALSFLWTIFPFTIPFTVIVTIFFSSVRYTKNRSNTKMRFGGELFLFLIYFCIGIFWIHYHTQEDKFPEITEKIFHYKLFKSFDNVINKERLPVDFFDSLAIRHDLDESSQLLLQNKYHVLFDMEDTIFHNKYEIHNTINYAYLKELKKSVLFEDIRLHSFLLILSFLNKNEFGQIYNNNSTSRLLFYIAIASLFALFISAIRLFEGGLAGIWLVGLFSFTIDLIVVYTLPNFTLFLFLAMLCLLLVITIRIIQYFYAINEDIVNVYDVTGQKNA